MHRSLRIIVILTLVAAGGRSLAAGKPRAFVFKPAKGSGPFPVAVWLHGYRGYSPAGYVPGQTPAALQKHADALGAVIVGFPATVDLGDGTQQWSEEPATDHAYVQARLRQLEKTAKLDLKRVALFGFSQGALVAGDLATLYPDSYLGAILMSPGALGDPRASTTKSPKHSTQVYFCFCGAEEGEGNVQLTQWYAKHLAGVLGAKVTLKLYPDVSDHARPPDFMTMFPGWMSAILGARDPRKP
jgi:predicted esterase